MNTAAQVELDSLLAAGGGAIVAGLAVTLAYALGLRGLIAAADRRREGRPGSRSSARWAASRWWPGWAA